MHKTLSDSENFNFSKNSGTNFSLSRTIGREYVSAHAQAAEAQLQRYMARFEQSRTMGCWNVGVYLLAKDPNTAQQGATQLAALLSGEKSSFEAIRIHDIHRAWASGIQVALSDFQQPAILISLKHPNTKERSHDRCST